MCHQHTIGRRLSERPNRDDLLNTLATCTVPRRGTTRRLIRQTEDARLGSHNSGMSGSTSTSWSCLLTFNYRQGSAMARIGFGFSRNVAEVRGRPCLCRTHEGGSTSRRIEPDSRTVLPLADGTAESSAFATADALIGL
jgi:hypothetical protein